MSEQQKELTQAERETQLLRIIAVREAMMEMIQAQRDEIIKRARLKLKERGISLTDQEVGI